jgi:hypothetical protein
MPFAPKSGPSAPIVAAVDWSSLLRDFRAAVSPEATASIIYYRNMSFAAALCGECSNAEAAEANYFSKRCALCCSFQDPLQHRCL